MENQKTFNPNAFRDAIKAMQEQHNKVKNLLQTNLNELDRAINEKSHELDKTLKSVTVNEATTMIMDVFRDSVKTEMAKAEQAILRARHLRSHASYRVMDSFDGAGNMKFSDVFKNPPLLLSYNATAIELLALCPEFFFAAIEAHVRKTLLEDGAPQEGPSIAELLDKVEHQVGEIEAMEQERLRVKDEFQLSTAEALPSAFLEISERNHSIPYQERTPSIRTLDANGQEVPGMVRLQPQAMHADKSAIERELDAIDVAAQEDIERRNR